MISLPELLSLAPGGYYKIEVREKAIPADFVSTGWIQIEKPTAEPNDEDNYDHEVDPVNSGVNGERA